MQLHAGRNRGGDSCLYVAMGQTGDNLFVLQIDPQTGKFRQFASKVADTNYPRATLMSRSGRLYIGAAYAGRLLCFDPAKDGLKDSGNHPYAGRSHLSLPNGRRSPGGAFGSAVTARPT